MNWQPTPPLNTLPGFSALTGGEQVAVQAVLAQYGQSAPSSPRSFGYAYSGHLLEAATAMAPGLDPPYQLLLGRAMAKLGLSETQTMKEAA